MVEYFLMLIIIIILLLITIFVKIVQFTNKQSKSAIKFVSVFFVLFLQIIVNNTMC